LLYPLPFRATRNLKGQGVNLLPAVSVSDFRQGELETAAQLRPIEDPAPHQIPPFPPEEPLLEQVLREHVVLKPHQVFRLKQTGDPALETDDGPRDGINAGPGANFHRSDGRVQSKPVKCMRSQGDKVGMLADGRKLDPSQHLDRRPPLEPGKIQFCGLNKTGHVGDGQDHLLVIAAKVGQDSAVLRV